MFTRLVRLSEAKLDFVCQLNAEVTEEIASVLNEEGLLEDVAEDEDEREDSLEALFNFFDNAE